MWEGTSGYHKGLEKSRYICMCFAQARYVKEDADKQQALQKMLTDARRSREEAALALAAVSQGASEGEGDGVRRHPPTAFTKTNNNKSHSVHARCNIEASTDDNARATIVGGDSWAKLGTEWGESDTTRLSSGPLREA